MINTKEKIQIYDDTGRNDTFDVSEIHYEDDDVILCSVVNEWYEGSFKVTIFKVIRRPDLR